MQHEVKFTDLSPEEIFLWRCVYYWLQPDQVAADMVQSLDWVQVVTRAQANKMSTLLDEYLRQTELIEQLPPSARTLLAEGRAKFDKKARELTAVLQQYMPLAAAHQLDSLPLKGLWVSCNLYGNAAMRPGHDLDILVRRDRLDDCIALLEQMGLGRYWPDSLPDDFYKRHHLHLELSLPDCWTWVEIHWAFDHPRAHFTIDYEAVMARTTAGELLGVPVRDPNATDLLLYLSIHLVKHMVHLPITYNWANLPRLIVAEGRLMYFLDVALAVKLYEKEIDWLLLIQSAHQYGAVNALGSVLRVCHDYFDLPVPEWVLDQLPIVPPGRLAQRLHTETAVHTLTTYQGHPTKPLWDFLVAENYKFIFRPIRLLDFATYAVPGKEYLRRRYGRAGLTAVFHFLRAIIEYTQLGLDTLSALWQRQRGHIPTFVTRHD